MESSAKSARPKEVVSMFFEGAAAFEINADGVKSSELFTMTKSTVNDGTLLTFKGNPSAQSGSGVYINKVGAFGCGATLFVGDLQVQTERGGTIKLNGHRYSPYKIKGGKFKGKSVFVPEGLSIPEEGGKDPEPEEPQENEGFSVKLEDFEVKSIKALGACDITPEKGVISSSSFSVTLEGCSGLHMPETLETGIFSARVSGSSKMSGPVRCRDAILTVFGASHISGVTAKKTIVARAEGVSSVSAKMLPECLVTKHVHGLGKVTITK